MVDPGRRAILIAALIGSVTLAQGCDSDPQAAAGIEVELQAEATLTSTPAPVLRGTHNVVVIMTDDQRLDDMAVMPKTRRLIGDAGATFETSVVSFPLCCPSRATYLTGQYAHNHRVLSNAPDQHGGYAFLEADTALPVQLRNAGYETAHIGRYLNAYGGRYPTLIPPGWDHWVAPPGPSTYLMYDWSLNRNGTLHYYGSDPGDYQTDVYAGHARRYIEDRARHPDQPFFLSITPLAPHDEDDGTVLSPFDGPRAAERHIGTFEKARFERRPSFDEADISDKPGFLQGKPRLSTREKNRMIGSFRRRSRSLRAVDDLVAGVVQELRRHDLLESTYILFTSDNGFVLGEHRLSGKLTAYEESHRVPLMVRGPGVERGVEIDGLTANIDLAPTVADIADAEPLVEFDGISLLDALQRGRRLPNRAIVYENLDRSKAPRRPMYRGIRTRNYSYVEYQNGQVELYDLRDDPFQLDNLADAPESRRTARELVRRLRTLKNCAGMECATTAP